MLSRRSFITRTSAGLLAVAVAPGQWTIARPATPRRQYDFQPYRPDATLAPIVRVTPGDGSYTHTYFDVCPWSPSQRYLAVTRFPFQDRLPKLGEPAETCVIDLTEQTIETVYTTRAWGYQLGANVQWGPSDRYLYTNDVIDGEAVCVRIDLETGEAEALAGPKYDIAPDGSAVISARLELMNRTQYGYGLPDPEGTPPKLPPGAAEDDGLWRTDLKTNERTLLVSLAQAAEVARAADPDEKAYDGGTFYFWHCKFNRQSTRIMQVLRCQGPDGRGRHPTVLTFNPDGSDIRTALDRTGWRHGGHPNWHPDGEHIVAHLVPHWLGDKTMRFCLVPPKGDIQVLVPDIIGGGHPSIEQSGRYLITDASPREPVALDNGEVPLRLIDLHAEKQVAIATIFVHLGRHYDDGRVAKCDPHPTWSHDYKHICFNGAPDGLRQIFIANLSDLIS